MEGNLNPHYTRVSPQDLFNEAKLLKCLGQLALLILDARISGVHYVDSGVPFRIALHDAGYLLAVSGITFFRGLEPLWLGSGYNSKGAYPLICYHEEEEIDVFDEQGSLTPEFRAFCEDHAA